MSGRSRPKAACSCSAPQGEVARRFPNVEYCSKRSARITCVLWGLCISGVWGVQEAAVSSVVRVPGCLRQTLGSTYTVLEGQLESGKLPDPVRYKTMAEGFASGFAKTPAIYAAHFSSEEAPVFEPKELVTSDSPADLHLLLLPANIIAGGRHQFHGVGLARRSAVMGILHNHWLHLGYRLTLVDPHANAVIGSRRAKGETLRSVSGDWWEEALHEMTPAQREQLRSALVSMLQASLRETLAAAGLVPQAQ